MDECSFCGGSLHRQILPYYDQPWEGKTYRFENVPALVCAACGEIFFEAEVDQAIDQALTEMREPKGFARVPILDLSLPA